MMPSASNYLRLTELLAAASSLLITAEFVAAPRVLRDDGPLSWRLQRLRRPGLTRLLIALGLDRFLQYPDVLTLLWVRGLSALAAVALIATGRSPLIALLAMALLAMAFSLRNPSANDAADSLTLLTLLACTLAECVRTPHAATAALVFVAAQAALAYSTSGLLKVRHRGWWNGQFALKILSTAALGDRRLHAFFSTHRSLAVLCGAAVVLGDCILGLAPILPPPVCAAALCLGFLFHLAVARAFGINTYVWAFLSTYPAIWFISCHVYAHGL